MSKVYVVLDKEGWNVEDDDDGASVHAIFSTRESAERFAKLVSEDVEEFDLDAARFLEARPGFYAQVATYYEELTCPTVLISGEHPNYAATCYRGSFAYAEAETKEEALKIAHDLLAKEKAKAGIP